LIAAMRAAGATVTVSSTRRPAQRAYLMYCSWRIFKQMLNPQNAPAETGVDIDWVHRKLTAARRPSPGAYVAQQSTTEQAGYQ
jgi:hypothetical protein